MAMSIGAPLGWLLIESARGTPPVMGLSANPGLYVYMFASTMFVFGLFGLLLGSREDRLLVVNAELEQAAITDVLTGLRNARYFHARFEEEYAEHMRTGNPLAVVIFDIDFFKRVNDEHGHQVGDDVLAISASAIKSVTRKGETEARVGGEEFVLLLPGSDGERAREAAERARGAIAAASTRLPDGQMVRVTASAGVASTAELSAASARELYRAADEALYTAKAEGRDRTVVAAVDDDRPDHAGV
jgi:diguanylate cyclase (GGDEF)-like protein